MENIAIIYFSGTGNTWQIAKEIGNNFESTGKKVEYFSVEELIKDPDKLDTAVFELIGFGYPVHAFGPPRIYKEFLKNISNGNNIKAFTFKTMGDPLWNGGSNKSIRTILTKKGYSVFYEAMYVMQANVVLKYDDLLIEKLYLFAKEKAGKDVQNILEGRKFIQNNNFFLDLISAIFNTSEGFGCQFFGTFFYVKKSCILCAKCVKACPKSNIKIKNGKIKFGLKCTFCMRCFYECPENSINCLIPIKVKGLKKISEILKQKPAAQDSSIGEDQKGMIAGRIRKYMKKYANGEIL